MLASCYLERAEWRGVKPMKVVSGHFGRLKVHYEALPREGL